MLDNDGLIPAHAGKTCAAHHPRPHRRAHPRSRGENGRAGLGELSRRGSSPLTRGKHRRAAEWSCEWGLIPAHAGKTLHLRVLTVEYGAHPRSRGENHGEPPPGWPVTGSSPLTRGKRSLEWHAFLNCGLIPAHAGKTSSPAARQRTYPAHPRSRGENHFARKPFTARRGSSPLTRGKRRFGLC